MIRFGIILATLVFVASSAYAMKHRQTNATRNTHTRPLGGLLRLQSEDCLVSYARTLWANEDHELYAGVGTLVALNTAALELEELSDA